MHYKDLFLVQSKYIASGQQCINLDSGDIM